MAGSHKECVTERQREDCVGAILRAFKAREEADMSRGTKSAFPDPKHPRTTSYAAGSSVPDDLRAWRLTVATALRHVPRATAAILVARLTRRQKSAENSWEQIATQLGWATTDVRQAYRMGLDFVHDQFLRNDVTVFVKSTSDALAA